MIETIQSENNILAIIIRHSYTAPGIHFFTPPEFSQQLAYISHPQGQKILPHIHNKVSREVHYTQEVLFIRKGTLKAFFYDQDHKYIASRMLAAGDVLLLVSGGHSFEVVEDIEMFEVKQGPYTGEQDKTMINLSGTGS